MVVSSNDAGGGGGGYTVFVGAVGVWLDTFSLVYSFSFLFPSLWETSESTNNVLGSSGAYSHSPI